MNPTTPGVDFDLSDLGPLGGLLSEAAGFRLALKDLHHRYLFVNDEWMQTFNLAGPGQIIGKTVFDLFPQWRARRYWEEEEEVLKQGRTLEYREELINAQGRLESWRTLKGPWKRDGEIIGYINLGTRLNAPDSLEQKSDLPPKMVKEVAKHACSQRSLGQIAADLGISQRTLERRFTRLTGQTPGQYRLRCRINRAKKLLGQGLKLREIAAACGFSDQSHFTRSFQKATGINPKKYQSQQK